MDCCVLLLTTPMTPPCAPAMPVAVPGPPTVAPGVADPVGDPVGDPNLPGGCAAGGCWVPRGPCEPGACGPGPRPGGPGPWPGMLPGVCDADAWYRTWNSPSGTIGSRYFFRRNFCCSNTSIDGGKAPANLRWYSPTARAY